MDAAKSKSKAIVDAAKIKAKSIVDKAKEKSIGKKNSKEIVGAAKEKAKAIVDAAKIKAKAIVDKEKEKAIAQKKRVIQKRTQRGGDDVKILDHINVHIKDILNKVDINNSDYHSINIQLGGAYKYKPKTIEQSLSNMSKLKKLALSFADKLTGDESVFQNNDFIQEITTILPKLPKLETLIINTCWIPKESWIKIANTLPNMKKLNTIYIMKSIDGLDDALTGVLSNELSKMTGLTTLNLRSNQIGDEGAAALARALPSMTGLTELDLESNQIGHEGAGDILLLLIQYQEELKKLQKVSLCKNKITDHIEVSIINSNAVANMKYLKFLDLSENQICDTTTIQKITTQLDDNNTFRTDNLNINLSGQKCNSEGGKAPRKAKKPTKK